MSKKTNRLTGRFGPDHFGILLILVGIALMVGFGFADSEGGFAVGFIVFAIGMIFLGF